MNILFLDQSGQLGGAELSLLDLAKYYRPTCLVGLFADGPFQEALIQQQVPVQVLATSAIQVRKDGNLWQGLKSLSQVFSLVAQVAQLSRRYDVIYANTQKALVIGALASAISGRPLIYHLRDILSIEHFSRSYLWLAISLANRFASLVIANSQATQAAFIAAGGRANLTHVVYNGFELEQYQNLDCSLDPVTSQPKLNPSFIVGHFSRLSPWKGQHVLIEALQYCSEHVIAIFVGGALFGEQPYIEYLKERVIQLKLQSRVQFLGFRSDVPQLMAGCDLVAHTSTAPEPFGRVIVEAMLSGKPVVATAAGGAVELIEHLKTGWLVPPDDPLKLAAVINQCCAQPTQALSIAHLAQEQASERFHLDRVHQQITHLLTQIHKSADT
jgi:glycosyltransferase involved in cell wall biosynthesis